jgi:hypothetical protein
MNRHDGWEQLVVFAVGHEKIGPNHVHGGIEERLRWLGEKLNLIPSPLPQLYRLKDFKIWARSDRHLSQNAHESFAFASNLFLFPGTRLRDGSSDASYHSDRKTGGCNAEEKLSSYAIGHMVLTNQDY